jgi:transcriptional activator of cad operon
MIQIGAWHVNPASGQIYRDLETAHLEVRAMRLLLCLAEHPGEVVSIDQLLDQVWTGVNVTPDSVYQAVASLRRLLGDDPKHPIYIETIPRLGYRMVAKVTAEEARGQPAKEAGTSPNAGDSAALPPSGVLPPPRAYFGLVFRWAAGAGLLLGVVAAGTLAFRFYGGAVNNSSVAAHAAVGTQRKSIAVLPFLDLSEGMKEQEFADGMTEELIDKFSKIPGLRVPAPSATFYFKNKHMPVADIARTLGVGYVLDGSVRKSGAKIRVAARLFCANSGYVIWSESYDRPFDDILRVQDDIAGEVTKALKASISVAPHPARLSNGGL